MNFRKRNRIFLQALSLAAVSVVLSSSAVFSEQAAENEIYESPNPAMAEAVREITWPYYETSREVAINSPELGRLFTDHKTAHALLTTAKTLEAVQVLKEAVEKGSLPGTAKQGHVAFGTSIDMAVVEGAALSHDTGMSGSGYALTEAVDEAGNTVKDENGSTVYEYLENGLYALHHEDNSQFTELRSNHSFNSALIVLINRERYKAAGYSDEQVDHMAILCMAHSKSTSGVRDLNSREDWLLCFDRMDSLVYAYNQDHPDAPISFERTPFEQDEDLLAAVVTESLAIRVGDVSRDSHPDAEAQSGELVHIDRSTIDDHGGSIEAEIEPMTAVIGEEGDELLHLKDRQVHAGEQNITMNRMYLGDDGVVTHEITVADGCSAPLCTQSSIGDHLGELYSARDGQFAVSIVFESFEDDEDGFFRESYEDFRMMAAQDYPNVTIHLPFDEEEES
ncbi:MAG: hypothetical protein IJX90_13110 [Blautia sp.]|nr:hypothetical protein [Blautia sp.]